MMKEYTISIDIAKKSDYTAVQIFKKKAILMPGKKLLEQPAKKRTVNDLVFMTKLQGMNYEDVANKIVTLATLPKLLGRNDIIVDGTGVGEAVVDMLRARKLYPYPIVFTNGNETREVYASVDAVFGRSKNLVNSQMKVLKQINVPKKDLVDAAVLMLQQGRLRLGRDLKYREDFIYQLSNFKGKINEKGNRKFEADKESTHDDLVAAFLMYAWWDHYQQPNEIEEVKEDKYKEEDEDVVNFKLF